VTLGLSTAEATARQSRDGFNELPKSAERGLLAAIFALLFEPMSLLLLVCGAIYVALGDRGEGALLLGFVVLILLLTLVQERKTESALAALRDLASPRALVVRDGERRRIAGRDVVVGDVLILSEGDRIAADGVVLPAETEIALRVDESLLTGEAQVVRKRARTQGDPTTMPRPGKSEETPFVYGGTLVTAGVASVEVLAIAGATEMGRIGGSLRSRSPAKTPLQEEVARLVTKLAIAAALLSAVAAIGYGVHAKSILGGILAGLTLAMAILPNEFPVVVTLFLALGARRLATHKVLARRIPVVEALGAVSVLCVDKTGTLTENRMTVRRVSSANSPASNPFHEINLSGKNPLPEEVHATVEYAILASRKDPFDPMERAFHNVGDAHLTGTEHLHQDYELAAEFPLTRARLAVIQVWNAHARIEEQDRQAVVAAKGAPETIAALCKLPAAARAAMDAQVADFAREGLRVLAVARGSISASNIPKDPAEIPLEYLGLVGLVDPVREEVPAAIAACQRAGVRVVMITGDNPGTAIAIARQAGIALPSGDAPAVTTGAELARLGDAELAVAVRSTNIFARMLPEQKLRLVGAFASSSPDGAVVAMTGDGVNDAPALQAAAVGVAMGGRGTDVAREASSIVLLEDDFTALVSGIAIGRRILDNLQKALAYVLAVHIPIVGLTLVPIAVGAPLVLLPIHVAFLHLVIDPACTIVFEAEPPVAGIMERPPRDPRAPVFGARVLGTSLLQGLLLLAAALAAYFVALQRHESEAVVRTVTFATFLVGNLALIALPVALRAPEKEPRPFPTVLVAVSVVALVFQALTIYVPPLAALFRFAPPPLGLFAGALVGGVASVFGGPLIKRAFSKKEGTR
jgi:Ca2+-transporting ATPase